MLEMRVRYGLGLERREKRIFVKRRRRKRAVLADSGVLRRRGIPESKRGKSYGSTKFF